MSNLKVFNTLTGKKEVFEPLDGTPVMKDGQAVAPKGRVLMYACGPTVYDESHLGHARMTITYDVVQRFLRFSGYDVTYVRNITDVDDKIINRARESGKTPEQIAREYTYTFWRDMHALNVEPPNYEPRCTEYIERMIDFVQRLIDKKHAYVSGSDVYFDVTSFQGYGKLKKQNLSDMMSGSRDQVRSQQELAEAKRHPFDFALWKGVELAEDGVRIGELVWKSPWGWGRPGWHLECSTMVKHVLGETIDIHAGGEDLVFPHHENEIAQSESLHDGRQFARYWLHNSFVRVDSEKMSKSLGNFRTISDILRSYSPDAVRLFLLQTHYRSPIEFTAESMNAASAGMQRLVRAARLHCHNNGTDAAAATAERTVLCIKLLIEEARKDSPAFHDMPDIAEDLAAALGNESIKELTAAVTDFSNGMNNDFGTPEAVSVLFRLADQVQSSRQDKEARLYAAMLRELAGVLGFTLEDRSQIVDTDTARKLVDFVLEIREDARKDKNYKVSDEIRKRLADLGISVMDVKGAAATWERNS